MARPTKLTEALITKGRKYKWTGDVLPTIEGFALHLEVSRSTVYEWMVPKEGEAELSDLANKFSDIVNQLLAEQSKLLINNGLRGKFNPTITKLILSGKHGYVEKSGVEHSGNMPVPILGALADAVPGDNSTTQDSPA